MVDLVALKADIDLHIAGTDPDWTGIFTALSTDQQVLDAYFALTQDNPAPFSAVVDYLMSTRAHTNTGQDTAANNTTPSVIMGRLVHAAEQNVLEAALPINVFGDTKTITVTRQLHSCKAFLEMLRTGVLTSALFQDGGTQGDILNDLVNCGVMNAANRTAIIALSLNTITRATEKGFGAFNVNDVATARAL